MKRVFSYWLSVRLAQTLVEYNIHYSSPSFSRQTAHKRHEVNAVSVGSDTLSTAITLKLLPFLTQNAHLAKHFDSPLSDTLNDRFPDIDFVHVPLGWRGLGGGGVTLVFMAKLTVPAAYIH